MCTLSIIPITENSRAGVRIAFNRDERRSRPAAQPPRQHRIGPRLALMPTDPASGGTWIAVSDAGLAMALLNVNPRTAPLAQPTPLAPRQSRGQIIPALLHHHSIDAAVQQALNLRAADYPPFRLVIASARGSIELASDGNLVRCGTPMLPGRVGMFTSSGLGDHLVDQPRRRLFDQMLGDGQHSPQTQDAFHRHQWPDRTHLSVNMIRPDARTVSRVVIELTATRAAMSYASLDETGAEREHVTDALALVAGGMKIDVNAGAASCESQCS